MDRYQIIKKCPVPDFNPECDELSCIIIDHDNYRYECVVKHDTWEKFYDKIVQNMPIRMTIIEFVSHFQQYKKVIEEKGV